MEAGIRPIRLWICVCDIEFALLYRKRQPVMAKDSAPAEAQLLYMDGYDLTNTIYCRQPKNLKKFKKIVI